MNHVRRIILIQISLLTLVAMMATAESYPPPGPALASAEPGVIILLLKFLRSPDYTATVPAILPFLHHENGNVVRDTCRTLGAIGNKDAIPAIEPLLKDRRSDVRKDAKDALDKLQADHPPANQPPPRQIASLDTPDIIKTLKILRHPEFSAAVPAILPLLHHENGSVRRDACRTLAEIATKDVIPAIEPLLKDRQETVRKDAEDSIAALKAKP